MGLYLKHSFQMFLLGKFFKETLCRRNVKTSVIRSWRKGWKSGGGGAVFILSLQETPCNSLSWLSKALSIRGPRVICLGLRCLLVSPGTLLQCQVPPRKADRSSSEGRNGGVPTVSGQGRASNLVRCCF